MRGLELARRYWTEVGLPAFERRMPELLDSCAVGLVGEGSECFGFDDDISQDHDWGPKFCIWLTRGDMERFGRRAGEIFDALPQEFLGYRRLRESPMSAGRFGVLEIDAFYSRFLPVSGRPFSLWDWNALPESGLAAATNGELYFDTRGEFTAFRELLLGYYPEDVRRKRLAAHCALAAQAGQYNYYRCSKRGERAASFLACAEFISHVQSAAFLLNRSYCPYYKWANRALSRLPLLGREASGLLEELAGTRADAGELIERISQLLTAELKRQGLSRTDSDFLLHHALEIQAGIADDGLRALHLMQE